MSDIGDAFRQVRPYGGVLADAAAQVSAVKDATSVLATAQTNLAMLRSLPPLPDMSMIRNLPLPDTTLDDTLAEIQSESIRREVELRSATLETRDLLRQIAEAEVGRLEREIARERTERTRFLITVAVLLATLLAVIWQLASALWS